MIRNNNFLLRCVAGKQVVVPVGDAAVTFPGMITLNETGSFLWNLLEQEQTLDTLLAAMTKEYDVSARQAAADIKAFTDRLIEVGAVKA